MGRLTCVQTDGTGVAHGASGAPPLAPGRRTLLGDGPGPRPGFEDYRVLGLQGMLRRLDPGGPRRAELVAAAAAADRSIAGRATRWCEPLAGDATPDGQALWHAAERHSATLYRRAVASGAVAEPDPAVASALDQRGTGQPLPAPIRREMERSLGVSLAGVVLHTDAVAARAAGALGAEAFTVGEDIFFSESAFAPDTQSGRRLLAHELAHVAQALRGRIGPASHGLQVSQPGEPLEQEAERFAGSVERGNAHPLEHDAGVAMPATLVAEPARVGHDAAPAGLVSRRVRQGQPSSGGERGAHAVMAELLPAGVDHRAEGTADRPRWRVRTSWMEAHGVARDFTGRLTLASHADVIRALTEDLRTVFPWVGDVAAFSHRLALDVDPALAGRPAITAFWLPATTIALAGLPRGERVRLEPRGTELDAVVTRDHLASVVAAPADEQREVAHRPLLEDIVARAERAVGMPATRDGRARALGTPLRLPGRLGDLRDPAIVIALSEATLRGWFGDAAWRRYTEGGDPADSDGAGPAAGTSTGRARGGHVFPPGTPDADELARLLGGGRAPGGATEPVELGERDVAALRQAASDPDLLARLRAAPGPGRSGQSLADRLEVLRAQREIERARQRTRTPPDTRGTGDPPPVPRPVHGRIRQLGGELVVGQPARFVFELEDPVVLPVTPAVYIEWSSIQLRGALRFARLAQGPMPGPRGVSQYVLGHDDPDEAGWTPSFHDAGSYEVHAIVHHALFYPNHFALPPVTVRSVEAQLDETAASALRGFAVDPHPRQQPHHFDVLRYGDGQDAHGHLTPEAMHEPAVAPNLRAVNAELERLNALVARERDPELVRFAQARIHRLAQARDELMVETPSALRCRGAFVSQAPGVPHGPLNVVVWMSGGARSQILHSAGSRPALPSTYGGTLFDYTQLDRPDNHRFSATASTPRAVLESLFVRLTEVYPDGVLSLACQLPGSDEFVQFTRTTHTVRRDVRNAVFAPEVSLAVDLATTVLMLFPPTAAIGAGIGIAYSMAQRIDQLEQEYTSGTLWQHRDHIGTAVIGTAIDLLPLRGARRAGLLGGIVHYTATAAQFAGMAYVVRAGVMDQIDDLRQQEISALAAEEARLRQLQAAVGPDAREARELSQRIEQARVRIRTRAAAVIRDAIVHNGLLLVRNHMLGELVHASTARDAAPTSASGDGRVSARPNADDPATTGPAPAHGAGSARGGQPPTGGRGSDPGDGGGAGSNPAPTPPQLPPGPDVSRIARARPSALNPEPPAHAGLPDYLDHPGELRRTRQPDRYANDEHFGSERRARYYTHGDLEDGVLYLDFQLRRDRFRSGQLNGRAELDAILDHFGRDRVHTIAGNWRAGDNLDEFNAAFQRRFAGYLRAGRPAAAARTLAERMAALDTWTGTQARSRGYSHVEIRSDTAHNGERYTEVYVRFHREAPAGRGGSEGEGRGPSRD